MNLTPSVPVTLEIARRSVNELCDCVRSAVLKGYVSAGQTHEFHSLTRRLYPALNNFIGIFTGHRPVDARAGETPHATTNPSRFAGICWICSRKNRVRCPRRRVSSE